MNRRGGISLLLLIGVSLIALAVVGWAFNLYQKEHVKVGQLQAQVDELTVRQKATEEKLAEFKKQATALQLRLQEAKTQIETLTGELDQEKKDRQEAVGKLEQQKKDLEQQKSLRQDLENKLNQAQEDGKGIKARLKVIEQQKADLEQKIKDLEAGSSGVELGKVVVNNDAVVTNAPVQSTANPNAVAPKTVVPAAPAAPQPPALPQPKGLEAKVMVVNREYNFVVINLGVKDGIKIGDQFLIYHQDKLVGEVKVEKVHESMAAAGFSAELKDAISENDKAVQKAK